MGAWGTGIYEDDVASDVRAEFSDALEVGRGVAEADGPGTTLLTAHRRDERGGAAGGRGRPTQLRPCQRPRGKRNPRPRRRGEKQTLQLAKTSAAYPSLFVTWSQEYETSPAPAPSESCAW